MGPDQAANISERPHCMNTSQQRHAELRGLHQGHYWNMWDIMLNFKMLVYEWELFPKLAIA